MLSQENQNPIVTEKEKDPKTSATLGDQNSVFTPPPHINSSNNNDLNTIQPQKLSILEGITILIFILLLVGIAAASYTTYNKYKGNIPNNYPWSKDKDSVNEGTSHITQQSTNNSTEKLQSYPAEYKIYGLEDSKIELQYGSVYNSYEAGQKPELSLNYDDVSSGGSERFRVRLIQSDVNNKYPGRFVRCPGYTDYTVVISESEFIGQNINFSKDNCIKLDENDYIFIGDSYDHNNQKYINVVSKTQHENVVVVIEFYPVLKNNSMTSTEKQNIVSSVRDYRHKLAEVSREELAKVKFY